MHGITCLIEIDETCHPVLISTGEETQELLAEETRRLFHEKVTMLTPVDTLQLFVGCVYRKLKNSIFATINEWITVI